MVRMAICMQDKKAIKRLLNVFLLPLVFAYFPQFAQVHVCMIFMIAMKGCFIIYMNHNLEKKMALMSNTQKLLRVRYMYMYLTCKLTQCH